MKRLSIILLIIFISGCASTQKMSVNNESDTNMGIIDESFNPANLDDDEIIIKRKKTKTESSSNYDMTVLDYADNMVNSDEEISGYRVQICAVADEIKARDIQRDAILKFMENVYLIYDSPYYKVRVGDCVNRFEADLLQKSAVEKGFDDAWVVKTKVKPSSPKESKSEENEVE